jgi:hypothetical protein
LPIADWRLGIKAAGAHECLGGFFFCQQGRMKGKHCGMRIAESGKKERACEAQKKEEG